MFWILNCKNWTIRIEKNLLGIRSNIERKIEFPGYIGAVWSWKMFWKFSNGFQMDVRQITRLVIWRGS